MKIYIDKIHLTDDPDYIYLCLSELGATTQTIFHNMYPHGVSGMGVTIYDEPGEEKHYHIVDTVYGDEDQAVVWHLEAIVPTLVFPRLSIYR
jgi:hypothetical protein